MRVENLPHAVAGGENAVWVPVDFNSHFSITFQSILMTSQHSVWSLCFDGDVVKMTQI